MKICSSCFSDKELRGFISSSTEIGDCDVCGSKQQPLIDVSELFDFFQNLLNNFKVCEIGVSLIVKIQSNWNFFCSDKVATKILDFVLQKVQTKITSSSIHVDFTDDIIENYSHWESLKADLKWKNRFVIDIEGLKEFGWDGFFSTQFNLINDVQLYRARLHHESGSEVYQSAEMFCPRRKDVSGGRANPSGIPFLYLSDNLETVLYEVRASYLDELSIGTFQLKPEIDSLKIVDFTENTSLFQSSINNETTIKDAIKSKLLKQEISGDLSKPMRRYDSELEYIPTQFICEFIKVFTGAGGIRFRSSLHPEGNNIVLFDHSVMLCKSVKKVRIESIKLDGVDF